MLDPGRRLTLLNMINKTCKKVKVSSCADEISRSLISGSLARAGCNLTHDACSTALRAGLALQYCCTSDSTEREETVYLSVFQRGFAGVAAGLTVIQRRFRNAGGKQEL